MFYRTFMVVLAFIKQLIFDRQSQESILSENFDIKRWLLFLIFVTMVFVILFLSKRLLIVTNLYIENTASISAREKALTIREKVLNGQLNILYDHESKLSKVLYAVNTNNNLIKSKLINPQKLSLMEKQITALSQNMLLVDTDIKYIITLQKEDLALHHK